MMRLLPNIGLALLITLLGSAVRATESAATTPRSMTTEFICKTTLPALPAGTKEASLWIPVPSNSEWQKVESLTVEGVTDYKITKESRYKNRMVYVHIDAAQAPLAITVRYTVNRKEVRVLTQEARHPKKASEAYLKMNLLGEKSLPIGGRYLTLSTEATTGKTTLLDKTRALYDHVLQTMQYDYKSESPKLGQGDSDFVCDYKKGDCADLHSYLISLARTQNIPIIHEFGFGIGGVPLPSPLPTEAKISTYHCYALVYHPEYGWIPVDASDGIRWADRKRADMRDYMFGNLVLERNAVAVSLGRNLTLAPPQKGEPLNKFIYPYLEADGKPVKLQVEMSRRLIKLPEPAETPIRS